mmetsp:Transcript_39016/g.123018  ORF Transcript_39016/g.123018 Transcript_39016/m.123018 type:complete len:92 (-) Transcript_39016:192-467(-)
MLIFDDACTLYLGAIFHIPLVELIAGICLPDFVDVDFDGVLPARLDLVCRLQGAQKLSSPRSSGCAPSLEIFLLGMKQGGVKNCWRSQAEA